MPEFLRQPQQSNLAALLAQMQARRADPIAEGITRAAQAIGGGLEARAERRTAADVAAKQAAIAAETAQRSNILDLLGKGTLAQPGGQPIDLASLLQGVVPRGTTFIPQRERGSIPVTPEILTNYPKIKKLGYQPGDAIPSSIFLAQTREIKAEKAPSGFRFTAEGNLEPIPGGKEAVKREEQAEKVTAARKSVADHAKNVTNAASKALSLIGPTTTGITGAILSRKPGSDRKSLEGFIDTLKSNLSFERLQEMRDNSKTGGALGNVSDTEIRLLGSSVTSLNPDQDPGVLKGNISKVLNQYQEILNKLNSAAPVTSPTGPGAPDLTPRQARIADLRAELAKGGK